MTFTPNPPSTKEGFLAFARSHHARLLFSSEPDKDGGVCHYYDMDGLPKKARNGANLKARLSADSADFLMPDGDHIAGCVWWVFTPQELGLHPAACTLLLAVGADALALLHLPPADACEGRPSSMFLA